MASSRASSSNSRAMHGPSAFPPLAPPVAPAFYSSPGRVPSPPSFTSDLSLTAGGVCAVQVLFPRDGQESALLARSSVAVSVNIHKKAKGCPDVWGSCELGEVIKTVCEN